MANTLQNISKALKMGVLDLSLLTCNAETSHQEFLDWELEMLSSRLCCSHKSFERVYRTRELRKNISVDVRERGVARKTAKH